MGHIPVNFTSKLHCLISHVAVQFALHMVRCCCCREVANGDKPRLRVLPLFIGESCFLFSLVQVDVWVFHPALAWVTLVCNNPMYLCNPSCSWGMESDCIIMLRMPLSACVYDLAPCRFIDQFCRLLQFSVPLIQFWPGHAGASSCSAFFLQEDPMQPFSCFIAISLAHAWGILAKPHCCTALAQSTVM